MREHRAFRAARRTARIHEQRDVVRFSFACERRDARVGCRCGNLGEIDERARKRRRNRGPTLLGHAHDARARIFNETREIRFAIEHVCGHDDRTRTHRTEIREDETERVLRVDDDAIAHSDHFGRLEGRLS